MAFILPIEEPWTSQPQVPVGIDWSNQITRGLVELVIGAQKISLTKIIIKNANPYSFSITPIGLSSSGYYATGTTTISSELFHSPVTIFCRYFHGAANPSGGKSIARFSNDGDLIGFSATPYVYTVDYLRNYSGLTISTSGAPVVGTAVDLIFRSNSNTSHEFRVKRLGYSETVTSSTDISSVSYLDFDYFAFGSYPYHLPVIFGLWNRALSDAEVTSLSANPWQIFSP